MKTKILVVDDEESIRFTFNFFLSEAGHEVTTVDSYDTALPLIENIDFDIIFADIVLESKTGIDLLKVSSNLRPTTPVIMITGAPSIESATESLRIGALDYIIKPILQDTLLRVTTVALKHRAMVKEKENCRLNFEAIFKSVKDGIVALDCQMRVTEVNQAATRLCGFQPKEVIGKSVQEMTHRCEGRCVDAIREVIDEKKPLEVRYIECHLADKPRQVISLTASPLLGSNNEVSGSVAVLRDETRLHMLERDREERRECDRIVGKSTDIRKVKALIREIADVQTTVLITGESGTGKELVVDALHRMGDRRDKPLIKVNCTALSDQLLESELFGHVRGAFTGAIRNRIGRFECAHGGIVFLDEIGDISSGMQSRLLRVIETGAFERVGESLPVSVDVRVVAATNQNLQKKVSRGEFREDLYYRLKVVEINMPSLRERRNDISLLIEHFLKSFNRKFDKKIGGFSTDAYKALMNHHWPGNVRELENTLEQAFIRCRQGAITIDHLPAEIGNPARLLRPSPGHADMHDEAQRIRLALMKTAWNKSKAARLLGMSRRTIYRRIKQHAIRLEA